MEWTFENIIYVIAGVMYTLFAIRLILTLIGVDCLFDVNFDFDTDFDIDLGDILSFKGTMHFLMGFSGYLSYRFHENLYTGIRDVTWAAIIGLVLMILLYFTYAIISKLDSKAKPLSGEQLVGHVGTVDSVINQETHEYIVNVYNGLTSVPVKARSNKNYKPGSEVVIQAFTNNFYLI